MTPEYSMRGGTSFTLPLDGGGSGWGWCTAFDVLNTPLPIPPPQAGTERFCLREGALP